MIHWRFERERYRATMRLVHRLGHDLASPLSAVGIHLELAGRQLAKAADATGPLESLRMAQRGVQSASAILNVLSEVATREDEDDPVTFSLSGMVRRGAARATEERDAPVQLPEDSPLPALFGCVSWLESAVTSITTWALTYNGEVAWSIESDEASARMICQFKGALKARNPDQLFGVSAPDLFLARWAIESHGGTLTAQGADGVIRFSASFPKEAQSLPHEAA